MEEIATNHTRNTITKLGKENGELDLDVLKKDGITLIQIIQKKMSKKKKPIYVLDHKLRWRAFKELQDRLVQDSGPVPVHGDKVLWRMMRKRLILCWFDPYVKGDMRLGFELPKGREVIVIANPDKK